MSSHLLVYQIIILTSAILCFLPESSGILQVSFASRPTLPKLVLYHDQFYKEMKIQSYVHYISGCDCSVHEGINITNLFQIPIQNRRFDTYYRSILLQTNESKSNNGAVLCCLQHTVQSVEVKQIITIKSPKFGFVKQSSSRPQSLQEFESSSVTIQMLVQKAIKI